MKQDPEALAPVPSQGAEVTTSTHDAVFGVITEDGPNYRNVGWVGTSIIMMKTQIGLGVLSIPAAFDILGMIPGVICMMIIAALTTWGAYVIGPFKLKHPEIYGIDDATGLVYGPVGRELLSIGFSLFLIFCAGSGILGISIGLNAVSTHGACTAVCTAVATIIVILLASIRTLSRISFLAWVGLVAILAANRPHDAPAGPWASDYKLVNNPSFTDAISAIATFVFAYAGTPFYFPIIAEMRDHRDYSKSMLLCQGVVTLTYLVIGIIVYYYCGSYVASSALGSAGPLLKKIGYGIALPGLIVSSTLSTHLVSKHFFVRILRGSKHLAANTFIHWATWLGCVCSVATTAYCIASGIPVFGGLVSLIGALLGTLMCFQPLGCMWLFDNWSDGRQGHSAKWILQVVVSIIMVVGGSFLMVGGTYGSVVGIIYSYRVDGGSKAWTCADNSNSV
ncbi:Amino acid transporter, transmembrane domain [Fusarium oxysporum f. sp. vasinfectum]|nr:Amino acid transporter, transmembrane domain [Fusarium oxysporum f. sp. vasinfectum]